jgi:hypothetical protein
MFEIWKDIPNYPDYQISNRKKIRKKVCKGNPIESYIKAMKERHGFYYFIAYNGNKKKMILLHVMSATLFVENPDKKPRVLFKDGDKSNWIPSNLMWATNQELFKSLYDNNIISHKGEKNSKHKITEKQARSIKRLLKMDVGQHAIANAMGCSWAIVNNIKRGTSWKHLKEKKL